MTPLSAEIYGLLERDLNSFEKLELMRYLRAAAAPVPLHQLTRDLKLQVDITRAAIGEMQLAGLLEAPPGLSPLVRLGAGARGEVLQQLMQIYDEDRVAILSTLSSISIGRIRTMAQGYVVAVAVPKKRDGDDR